MTLFKKLILVTSIITSPIFAQNGNAGNGNSNSHGNGNASGNGNGNTVTVDNKVGCVACVGGAAGSGGAGGGGSRPEGKKWHPPMIEKSGMASGQ